MEQYNSIDALVAPVRSGALHPLSGRFLVNLVEGRIGWLPKFWHLSACDTSARVSHKIKLEPRKTVD